MNSLLHQDAPVSYGVIDLFAGAGGWDLGARELGIDPIGLEIMQEACDTRRAAGLRTMQCDIAAVDFHAGWLPSRLRGLIASPPCQAYSMAGKGGGRRDQEIVVRCAMELAAGNDTRAERAAECEDPGSILVVEPLRWALALKPRWVAFEQVPPVLGLWTLFAQILGRHGYSCWTGVLSAERYGVPQTRKRAILMGSLDGPVTAPVPTHQAYVPGEPAREQEGDLFGPGLLPWVSMAQALGWQEGPSPSPSVTGGGGAAGGVEVFASKGARARAREAVAMRANNQPNAAVRHEDEPAPTIASGNSTDSRVWLRAGTNANDVARPADTPAPTLRFGERMNDVSWVPTHFDVRQTGATPRPVAEPAPTMLASGLAKGVPQWVEERPATTVAGDPRVHPPGHKMNADDEAAGREYDGRAGKNAVRVTQQEAATLQTFPADYPWQGSRSKQFLQIGNAVPPMLAKAVLAALNPESEALSVAA